MLLNFAQENIVLLKVYKKNDTDCYCHEFLCLDRGNMLRGEVYDGGVFFGCFVLRTALNSSHFL